MKVRYTHRVRKLLSLCAAGILSLTAAVATSQTAEEQRRHAGDDNLRLLEVMVDNFVMDEVLTAYQMGDSVMVPLGLLSEILGFAVTTHPGNATAEGFVLKENRRFFLDVKRGNVTLSGRTERFDHSRVHIDIDDIYVDADLLSEWLPIELDIDLFTLEAHIHPQEPLPLQQRLERERRIAKTRNKLMPQDPGYPRHSHPYRMWSTPFIDQDIRLGINKDSNGVSSRTFNYTTHATADLFTMESSWYLAGSDEDAVDEYRFTIGRRDSDGGLLGTFQATEYLFGHVEDAAIDLVSVSKAPQPGFSASNFPLHQQNNYDTHSFSGELLPGWEVELYHNNALLDYQQEPNADGQYRFANIPLLFGNNFFRLVFYGPHGQVREEDTNFVLDNSLVQPGKYHYRVTTNQGDDRQRHTTFKYDVGFSKRATAQLAFATLPVNDKQHAYRMFGLRGFTNTVFYALNITDDSQSGNIGKISLQTRLGSTNLSLSDAHLDNFESELFPRLGDPLARRSRLRLDTAVPPSFLPRIPVTFELERDLFESGDTTTLLRNRLSVQRRGFAASHDLTWERRSGNHELEGHLHLSRLYGYESIRSDLTYEMTPDHQIDAGTISVNSFRFTPFHLRVSATRSFSNNNNQYNAELSKRINGYAVTLLGHYTTKGDLGLQLVWRSSFGREPRTRRWVSSSRAMANQGVLSVRAFLDKDRNGVMNSSDKPLQGAGVMLGSGYHVEPRRTDENGILFIPHLPPYRPTDVRLAAHTLDDPLWVPAVEGHRVVPRPGEPIVLELPVLESGEIDGTVYINRDNRRNSVRGAVLELVTEEGEIITTTRSSFDGYFVISSIPLGNYRLRLSPSQRDRFNLQGDPPSQKIELSSEQLYLYDISFSLN